MVLHGFNLRVMKRTTILSSLDAIVRFRQTATGILEQYYARGTLYGLMLV